MDFGALLHKARRNEQGSKKEVRYYSTKYEPPKKEERSKMLSPNIQKFLARKQAEERQKTDKETRKRNELLALRAQDKKATRRVSVMLKRTKSADKSAILDAVDRNNTAVTMVSGSQPDEDDYGYVSQEAAAFYNKMMEKYNKTPDEPKFANFRKKVSTNLSNTKDRVRAALEKEKEEASLPHRRKRKHEVEEAPESPRYEEKPEKKKPKIAGPPSMDFASLLKLAEKKQYEPVLIEVKPKEEEVLLTKKQKLEQEKESQRKIRKPQESPPKPGRIPKLNKHSEEGKPKIETNGKIPKISNGQKPRPNNPNDARQYSSVGEKHLKPSETRQSLPNGQRQINQTDLNKSKPLKPVKTQFNGNPKHKQPDLMKGPKPALFKAPPERTTKKVVPERERDKPPVTMQSKNGRMSDSQPKFAKPESKLKLLNGKPKESSSRDLLPKQFPPKDIQPKSLPPGRKEFPMKSAKIKAVKGRIFDEEYDPDMDDFIDDGPMDQEDYSKHIKDIFGYDKHKYNYLDDDIDNMESSFSQQMKEEFISTKIGIMEDLEDIRNEEEQKRKKMLLKKRKF